MRRASTVSGLFWSVLDMGGGQVLSFATFLVLARILSPEEYGAFALASTFVSLAFFLLQGLAPAVVQRASIDEEHISTAFWTNLAIGAGLAAIMAGSADALAAFFRNPPLAVALKWMALVCLPMALVSVPMALFRRELDMSAFAARTVIGYLVGAAVSIPMALRGFGVVALALGQVAQWVATVLVFYALSSWRPKFRFSFPAFVELGRYCVHYSLAMATGFATSKVDMWILGAFLDPRSLGFYALALRLLSALSSATVLPVDLLVVSLLRPHRSEHAQFNAEYQRIVIGVTSAWLPIVAGVGVLATILVPTAFGAKWVDSVPVVQAMCLSAFTFSLTAFTGEALSAWGRPDLFSKLELVRLAVTTAAFAAAAPLGTVAAGLAWSLLPLAIVPIHLAVLQRTSGFESRRLVVEWAKVAASGAFMVATLMAMQQLDLFGRWLPVVEIAVGAMAYLFLIGRFMPGYIEGLLKRGLDSMPIFATQVKR
ncbi:MAG TPA: lipopolysaccharide biosynthesis protein [Alphaproteobacteria bacterium]|jgi:O-antigen/teichoic acid export membrane protein|nr:lipopolysaccharide biosynthesis protein [Alphaproteobacteria bacterium]